MSIHKYNCIDIERQYCVFVQEESRQHYHVKDRAIDLISNVNCKILCGILIFNWKNDFVQIHEFHYNCVTRKGIIVNGLL